MSISVKGTATQREYNRQLEKVYLDKMFDLITPNVEFPSSYKAMAELTEVPANIVSNVMKMLDKNGALKRRFEYRGGSGPVGSPDSGGRTAYWTITTTKEHAQYLLDKYQAGIAKHPGPKPKTNGGNIPIEAAIENATKNQVVAQAKAWVDKCRAYMKAVDLVNGNLESLKAAGINIDEEAYFKAINVAHDERLASIALVMPYIEKLEKRNRA